MRATPREEQRFLRVYFVTLERDHPATWYDPTALATWLRLLAASEKAWPAMPDLPAAVRRADLAVLTADGLLEMMPRGQFLLRGWVKERKARADKAKAAVAARGDRVGTDVPTTVSTDVRTPVRTERVLARAGASPSPSISSKTGGSPEGGLEPGEVEVFALLAQNGAAMRPDGGLGRRLLALMDRRTPALVLAKATELAKGERLSDRQWVFGLESAMERIPDPADAPKPRKAKPVRDREAEYVALSRATADVMKQSA